MHTSHLTYILQTSHTTHIISHSPQTTHLCWNFSVIFIRFPLAALWRVWVHEHVRYCEGEGGECGCEDVREREDRECSRVWVYKDVREGGVCCSEDVRVTEVSACVRMHVRKREESVECGVWGCVGGVSGMKITAGHRPKSVHIASLAVHFTSRSVITAGQEVRMRLQ